MNNPQNKEIARLMDASHMALGWMTAKGSATDPVIYYLAKTLRDCDSDSHYVKAIIESMEKNSSLIK